MADTATSQVNKVLSLTDTEMQVLVRKLNLSAEVSEDFQLVPANTDWNQIDRIREPAAFIGFNPKEIIAQFFKKAYENPIEVGAVPISITPDLALYEKNDPKMDLLFFLTVFLVRGNNLHKAALRSSGAIGAFLQRKCAAYGIVIDPVKNKTILDTKQLTLARLAQAFLLQTAAIIISKRIDNKLMSKVFPSAPLITRHTIFPGLIPQGDSDELRDICIILHAEMSILLATPKEKRMMAIMSFEEMMKQAEKYVDAAMNGSLIVPDSVKYKILVLAGLYAASTSGGMKKTPALKMMISKISKVRAHQRLRYSEMIATINTSDAPEN